MPAGAHFDLARDGRTVVAVADGKATLWDAVSGTVTGGADGMGAVDQVVLAPDGRTAAVVADERIRLWDLRTRRALGSPFGADTRTMDFTEDGSMLAAVTSDPVRAEVWRVADQKRVQAWTDERIDDLALSADGSRAAVVYQDGRFDVRRGVHSS